MTTKDLIEFCKTIPLDAEIECAFSLDLVDEGTHLKIESREFDLAKAYVLHHRRNRIAESQNAFALATRNGRTPTGYGGNG